MSRSDALRWVALLAVPCSAGSAQSVKLSAPMPLGPENNGERVFESAIGSGHVVYRADQDARDVFELYTVPLDGSAPAVKLSSALPSGGDVLSFQLSPDGTRVLYLADQRADEDYSYFSVLTDGLASPVEIARNIDFWGRSETPRITADGSRLVYLGLSGATSLLTVPMDGSTAPVVLASGVDAFTLSPDGSRAAFVDEVFRAARLKSVRLDGSEAPVSLFSDQAAITEFRFTADGARVVYVAWGRSGSTSGSRELFSLPADGSASRVRLSAALNGARNVQSFELAPDGTRAVYLANQTAIRFELFSAPVDGSQAAVAISGSMVTGANVAPAFEIAPQGRWVVFRSDREQDELYRLYRTPITGGSAPERLANLAAGEFELDPFGLRVVFLHPLADGTSELESVLLRSPRARDTNGNPFTVGPVRLSGDPIPGGTVLGFAIAPDARRVVYHASQDSLQIELFSAPIWGGAAPVKLNDPLVARGDVGGRDSYHISPDSSRVVYQADQELDQLFELYSVPLDRALAPVKLNDPLDPGPVAGDVLMVRLSADGSRFVYWADGELDETYELYSGRLDGGAPIVNLDVEGPMAEHDFVTADWSLSPDGQRVLFLSDKELDQLDHRFELYSVPTDGSATPVKLNQQIFGTGWISTFVVAPASDRVAFEWSDGLYIAPIQGGTSPLELSGGLEIVPFFRFLPDGSRLVFVTQGTTEFGDHPSRLYSAPADASQAPVELSGDLVNPEDVVGVATPARGERVAYVADQELDERYELFSAPADDRMPPAKLNGALAPGGSVHEVALGPRGDLAVYVADQDVAGVMELYSAKIHGAPPTRQRGGPARPPRVKLSGSLPAGADVGLFEIGPDGTRVAFTIQSTELDARLFGVPIDGSSPALAISAAGDGVQSFRFSPDGARLVYVARSALTNTIRIHSAPADGSAAPVELNGALVPGGNVVSAGGQPFRDASFAISPDSRWVAYVADQDLDERIELFLRPIDGSSSPTKLNDPLVPGGDVVAFGLGSPAFFFTPDSSAVVYLADQDSDDVSELYRRSLP